MSLPARQQRALDGIEGALRVSEPRMTAMFAIFTRLTQDDGPAAAERLSQPRGRMSAGLRALVLVPVVFAMLITGAVLGGNGHASGCGARLATYGLTVRGVCGRFGTVTTTGSGKPAWLNRPARPARHAKPASPVTPLISPGFNRQLPGVSTNPGVLQMR